MALNNEVQTSDIDLDKLEKEPRTYRTDKMIYRLTKKDVFRLKNNTPPMTKSDYANLHVALKVYLNEREKSLRVNEELLTFVKDNYKEPTFAEDLNYRICFTLLSYFYNVPYSKIPRLKNLDLNCKDRNLYRVMSYEELRYINIMKEQILKEAKSKPFLSERSILTYAQKLGTTARSSFMKNYKVEPILLEKGEYNCDEVRTTCEYVESILESQKKKAQNAKRTTTAKSKKVEEGREQ
ncbi:MAG: hypothetical protein IJW32_06055 [Clostridia bacterium]|nr:hypothetical protein [Clostridia bacterium]MBQ9792352.1 hypothetical protein [Clostridia bacterium]MBQ9793278.1 hypothetical protein [Clostridia bacterium]